MSEERRRILKMVAEGKITAEEAEKLLETLERSAEKSRSEKSGKAPSFFVVKVSPKNSRGDKVDIRIPMALLRAGVKMSSLLPFEVRDRVGDKLKDKGLNIDLKDIDSGNIEPIFTALTETSIDIDEEDETVRIYCE